RKQARRERQEKDLRVSILADKPGPPQLRSKAAENSALVNQVAGSLACASGLNLGLAIGNRLIRFGALKRALKSASESFGISEIEGAGVLCSLQPDQSHASRDR